MTSTQTHGGGSSRSPSALLVATAVWIGVVGWTLGLSLRDAHDSGALVLAMAAALALVALVAGLALWRSSGQPGWWAGGLVVSAVLAPTTFAYALNVLPLLTAVAVLWWARRRRRLHAYVGEARTA
jgi:hypothetical protein